jgi:hypothetical protein
VESVNLKHKDFCLEPKTWTFKVPSAGAPSLLIQSDVQHLLLGDKPESTEVSVQSIFTNIFGEKIGGVQSS